MPQNSEISATTPNVEKYVFEDDYSPAMAKHRLNSCNYFGNINLL